MEPRDVGDILSEWRAIERELEGAGFSERERLEETCAALATEYRKSMGTTDQDEEGARDRGVPAGDRA